MLVIIIIYFIGKYFYKLADKYEKSKWGYAILGIATYYFGSIIIGGMLMGFIDVVFDLNIDFDNSFSLGLIVMPFGILLAILLHWILEKNFKKNKAQNSVSIDEIGTDTE